MMHSVKKFFDVANQSAAAALNRKIIEISLRNFNSGLDLGKSLAGARNPFEVVTLVASFWWKQFDELRLEAEVVQNRLFGFSVAQLKFKSAEPLPDLSLCEPAKNSTTLLTKRRGPNAQIVPAPDHNKTLAPRKSRCHPLQPRLLAQRFGLPRKNKLQGSNPRKEINEPADTQIQLACSCAETAEAKTRGSEDHFEDAILFTLGHSPAT